MADTGARLTSALAGRYRVDRELGGGGMATVYLAEDLKHSRKVAIRVVRLPGRRRIHGRPVHRRAAVRTPDSDR
jgi:hypothetical protein